MFLWLGLSLALGAFGAVATLASLLTGLSWRLVLRIAGPSTPGGAARLLFALRLLPVCAAFFVAVALVVSAWIAFEPAGTQQPLRTSLAAAAGWGALLLVLAAGRALGALTAVRRLTREWTARGRPVRLAGAAAPAVRIEHDFPVVCVLGTLRPRLFVAGDVLDSCTEAELEAVLAHESSHLASRDNLKATVIRSLPDLVSSLPGGRAMEQEWQRASEAAADAHAARLHPRAAVDLAAALVRLARLAAGRTWTGLPGHAVLAGEGVSPRVVRLLAAKEPPAAPWWRRALAWAMVLAAPASILAAAGRPDVLESVHRLAEWLVHLG